jgi:ATP-binding cassette subfamily C exporter for protease/lipase
MSTMPRTDVSRAAAGSELRGALVALRRELVIVGALSMATNLLMLTPTVYMLQVYDRVLVSRSELTLLAVSVVAALLFAVVALVEWLRTKVLVAASVRLDRLLAGRLLAAAFEASLAPQPGEAARPLADLIVLRQFLAGPGALAFFDAPWVAIYIGVLFLLHPALGVMALAFGLVQGVLAWRGQQRSVAPAEAAARSGSAEMASLRQQMQGGEALEAMGMLGHLWQRWSLRRQQHAVQTAALQRLTHRITAVSKFIRYSQQSLALGLGSLLVIDGALSPGAMIAANVLMTRALAPIDALVGTWRSLFQARAAARRLQALLAAHPPLAAPAVPLSGRALRGAVTLRGVFAHASGRARPILDGIDLDLTPGSVTVVVGPSGSGKSTLARTLVGAWPQVAGAVLLDGTPLAEWPRELLGGQLGYLPQDIELFDGSIADNIARFAEVDSPRVIAAARSAGLHEVILRLPRGYDTPVGDSGAPLSGGQRQRIALARAVYGEPKLIVLDEPNANLDEAGEAALATLVRELKSQGRTVLLVSHRPAILAVADHLLVLREGRIERQGRPEQVVADLRGAAPPQPPPASASVQSLALTT